MATLDQPVLTPRDMRVLRAGLAALKIVVLDSDPTPGEPLEPRAARLIADIERLTAHLSDSGSGGAS
jgi:hypothetical protein